MILHIIIGDGYLVYILCALYACGVVYGMVCGLCTPYMLQFIHHIYCDYVHYLSMIR